MSPTSRCCCNFQGFAHSLVVKGTRIKYLGTSLALEKLIFLPSGLNWSLLWTLELTLLLNAYGKVSQTHKFSSPFCLLVLSSTSRAYCTDPVLVGSFCILLPSLSYYFSSRQQPSTSTWKIHFTQKEVLNLEKIAPIMMLMSFFFKFENCAASSGGRHIFTSRVEKGTREFISSFEKIGELPRCPKEGRS